MGEIVHLHEWKLAKEIAADSNLDSRQLYLFLCDEEVKRAQDAQNLHALYEKQLEYGLEFLEDIGDPYGVTPEQEAMIDQAIAEGRIVFDEGWDDNL